MRRAPDIRDSPTSSPQIACFGNWSSAVTNTPSPIVDNGQIFLGVNDMELDHPAVQPTGGGTLMCRNAKTGEIVWQHDMVGGVWCASATVVNGRVYVGTERMVLWVLKAGRAKEVLARSRTKSMAITAVAAEDIFYLPTQRRIFAVRLSE